MTKVNILRLDSVTNNDTTATSSINTNFMAIQQAMENTLSRDGTTPNFMDSNLDMNSYKIINAGDPENDTDVITKGWFDQYVDDAAGASAQAVAAADRAEGSAQAAETAAAQAAIAAGQIGDNVRLSRDWAIKMDGTVDGVDYSSKYYASQIIPLASDITTVSGIASDVTTVSGIATDVSAVADNNTDISAVAADLTDVSAVAGDLTNIDTVAGIASDISTVSGIASDVSDVADNETNINTVAGVSANVTTVAGISSDVTTVASNSSAVSNVSTYMSSVRLCADDISNINTVAVDISNVADVADNKTNIDTVAADISDVNTVAGISSDVSSVAAIDSDVSTVASNVSDISTVATDIANVNAVAGDLTNIDNASTYAAEAKQWAIGDPTEPAGNSAKYWAQQAAGQVIPSQTGHSGEFLTTDGSALSWDSVDALPSQTGQSGKYLTTDGSTASWGTIQQAPSTDNVTINTNASDELQAIGLINKNPSGSTIYDWEGTLAQYIAQNVETLHPEWTCCITDDLSPNIYPMRNIGEIVQSTIPLTDAGLHLLDGSLISSGSYADFVDYIAGLVSTYPDIFDTEANWQSAVTTYGVCGKFVYDSVNGTVRLPKYSDKIYTSSISNTAPVKGDGKALGLELITDSSTNLQLTRSSSAQSAFITAGLVGNANQRAGLDTDSTKSGVISDLANITTALEGYYYIVIATSTKTQIEVDIDEIATDLNGKADTDLSNCTVLEPCHVVTETYINGTSGYRVWSDGWCEQWGYQAQTTTTANAKTFLKAFRDTNYVLLIGNDSNTGNYSYNNAAKNKSTTGFTFYVAPGTTNYTFGSWYACGYIS